eukprot:1159934-Rhodomonas_salina.1
MTNAYVLATGVCFYARAMRCPGLTYGAELVRPQLRGRAGACLSWYCHGPMSLLHDVQWAVVLPGSRVSACYCSLSSLTSYATGRDPIALRLRVN